MSKVELSDARCRELLAAERGLAKTSDAFDKLRADYEALEARVRELVEAGELLDLAAVAFAEVLRGFPVDAAYRKGIHNADDAHNRWRAALAAFTDQPTK